MESSFIISLWTRLWDKGLEKHIHRSK